MSPDIRQSAFALVGDLARVACVYLSPSLTQVRHTSPLPVPFLWSVRPLLALASRATKPVSARSWSEFQPGYQDSADTSDVMAAAWMLGWSSSDYRAPTVMYRDAQSVQALSLMTCKTCKLPFLESKHDRYHIMPYRTRTS